jgi:hypothetical protein
MVHEGVWIDAPHLYGSTLYNGFLRRTTKGVWIDLFHTLAAANRPPEQVPIDSSAVEAHGCASGDKRGAQSGDRPLARRTHDQDPLRKVIGLASR